MLAMIRGAGFQRALIVSGLLACLLIGMSGRACAAQAAQSADHPLIVAYIDGETLYLWRQGDSTPRALATGDLSRPQFSPGVTRLFYQDGGALWIIDLNDHGNETPRPLVSSSTLNPGPDQSRQVLDAAWLDGDTVIFNTFRLRPLEMNKRELSDDLWRADVATGKVSQLLDQGQGGAFAISPDGRHVALSQPGTERPDPATISLVDSLGQNRVKLLEFPFVYTGASTRFYARPYWNSGGDSLFAAIPDPNLVYAADDAKPTILWRLSLDGKATRLGEVNADFFALPEFSPDGAHILYARRVGALADNRLALFRANSDGSGEQEIARDLIQAIEPAHWLPDGTGYTFVHGQPGEMWQQTGDGLRRLPNDQEYAFDLLWVDSSLVVYATSPGPGELRYGAVSLTLGGKPTATIARRTVGGDFDARREP